MVHTALTWLVGIAALSIAFDAAVTDLARHPRLALALACLLITIPNVDRTERVAVADWKVGADDEVNQEIVSSPQKQRKWGLPVY